jgi:SEC-C motif-containing protein
MKCPCHSHKDFSACCEPYLLGEKKPSTPVLLMRSRYAAYALDRPQYIIQTTHPRNPMYNRDTIAWTVSIHQFSQTTAFQGLLILSHEESALEGYVTFHAILKNFQGTDMSFIEKSYFLKEKGLWLYRSGVREVL